MGRRHALLVGGTSLGDMSIMSPQRQDALVRHLIATRLAGEVATTPGNTLGNCRKLTEGHPEYHFGLHYHQDATFLQVVEAVRSVCGGDPGGADPGGAGWIEPAMAVAGIERHRRTLAEVAGSGGARVLFATGHPGGLLAHYAGLARALQRHGCVLLTPLDDQFLPGAIPEKRWGIRFLEGVGAVFDGASLRHTHRSVFMEAMLDALSGGVDLVVADHGMAGAAIARGIRTISIADVNDPALPMAQVRGATDGVLPIDDNLAPRLFVPVTERMLDWS